MMGIITCKKGNRLILLIIHDQLDVITWEPGANVNQFHACNNLLVYFQELLNGILGLE